MFSTRLFILLCQASIMMYTKCIGCCLSVVSVFVLFQFRLCIPTLTLQCVMTNYFRLFCSFSKPCDMNYESKPTHLNQKQNTV